MPPLSILLIMYDHKSNPNYGLAADMDWVVLYSGKEDSSLMNALLAAEKEYFGFVAAIKSAIKSPLVYTRT